MRAEKKLSRTLDDEALRDLAREERRVKTRSKEGLSAAQAEDFKLKKRITEAAREQFTDAEWVKLDNAALIFRPLRARTKQSVSRERATQRKGRTSYSAKGAQFSCAAFSRGYERRQARVFLVLSRTVHASADG